MKFIPHDYQHFSIRWLIQRLVMRKRVGAMLLLDPGLGKTSITLSLIKFLIKMGLVKKVLLVAPLRVVYSVWRQEVAKWDQFNDLRVSIVHGPATKKMKALAVDADIYVTNCENMEWIYQQYGFGVCPFQMIVLDESSKFKTWSSNRTIALRHMVDRFRYRLCLTGTPCTNSLIHIFPQVYIADKGQALGKGITKFQTDYFSYNSYTRRYTPTKGSKEQIQNLISDVALSLRAQDHLDMPELVTNDVWIDLPSELQTKYDDLEEEMFIALDESGGQLTAKNAGAKYQLCKQFANGGVYKYSGESEFATKKKKSDRSTIHLHEAKIDAVEEVIDELNGKPVLISFMYSHDLERLQKRFGKRLKFINGDVSAKAADKIIEEWNNNEIEILACQPASLSHGINMQAGEGRDVVFLGLPDDGELYGQFYKRIWRQGASGQVRLHRILCRGTVDEAICVRLDDKNDDEDALLNALCKYRKQKGRVLV